MISGEWRADGAWRLLALWTGRSDFGVDDPLFHRDVGFFVFSLPLYEWGRRWLLATLVMAAVATVAAYVAAGGSARRARRGARTRAPARPRSARARRRGLALPARRVRAGGCRTTTRPEPATPTRTSALPALRILACAVAGRRRAAAVRRRAARPRRSLAAVVAIGSRSRSRAPASCPAWSSASRSRRRRSRASVRTSSTPSPRPAGRSRSTACDVRDGRRRRAVRSPTSTRTAARSTTCRCGTADVLRPAHGRAPVDRALLQLPQPRRSTATRRGVLTLTVAARSSTCAPWAPTRAAGRTTGSPTPTATASWPSPRPRADHVGAPAVRAARASAPREPARPARAARVLRRAAGARPAVRGRRTAAAPRSTGPALEPGYHYDGPGGIALSGPLRRSAFAVRFGDLNLLLSETVTDRSRILLHRDVGDRLRTLAPFLRWDSRPQTVVVGGREQVPVPRLHDEQSLPVLGAGAAGGRVNYVRAGAVAAVVDAFSGRIALYADDAGRSDPARVARRVYPGLFRPARRCRPSCARTCATRAACSTPRPTLYATYHADEPTAFWNGSDAWERAAAARGSGRGGRRDPLPDAQVDAERWTMRPRSSRAAARRRRRSASCSPRRSRRAAARTSSPTSPARSTRTAARSSRCLSLPRDR